MKQQYIYIQDFYGLYFTVYQHYNMAKYTHVVNTLSVYYVYVQSYTTYSYSYKHKIQGQLHYTNKRCCNKTILLKVGFYFYLLNIKSILIRITHQTQNIMLGVSNITSMLTKKKGCTKFYNKLKCQLFYYCEYALKG